MSKLLLPLLVALATLAAACNAPSMQSADAPAAAPALVAAESHTSRAPDKPGDIAWGDAIAWRDWDAALATAKAENKSLCVVVYADWCPRCKELAPVFETPQVAHAAKSLVMVRQDQDDAAAWLKERFGEHGSYVPRVFFLDPSGELRADLQSGHPRYPYFYAPMVSDRLLANMHAAGAR